MRRSPKILIIDDEEGILELLKQILIKEFEVAGFLDPRKALEQAQKNFYHVVITDLKMPYVNGLEVLKIIKASTPLTEVIIMTGYGDKQSAIEALRYGAYDYLEKPVEDIFLLKDLVKKALERVELTLENRKLVEDLKAANTRIEQQRIRDLQRISHVGRALASSLNQQEILSVLAQSLVEGTGCDAVGFLFLNYGRHKHISLFGALSSEDIGDIKFKMMEALKVFIPDGIIDPSVEEGELEVRVSSMAKNPSLSKSIPGSMLSTRTVPLVWQGEMKGILSIFSRDPEAFGNDDIRILNILATEGTIGLQNVRMFNEIQGMAIRDGLTNLFNHRHFHELLDLELIRAKRYGHPLSLLMLDIDFFKSVNDTWGHLVGDQVLAEFGKLLSNTIRETDYSARYGGEEFAVILTETPPSGAMVQAERIRKEVEERVFGVNDKEIKFTVSIGVANLNPDASGFDQKMTKEDLIQMADQGLYRAKEAGRNRCEYGGRDDG